MPTGTRPVGPRPPDRQRPACFALAGPSRKVGHPVGRNLRANAQSGGSPQSGFPSSPETLYRQVGQRTSSSSGQVRAFVVVTAPLALSGGELVRAQQALPERRSSRLLHRCASRSFGRTNLTSWAHPAARSGQPSIDASSVARAAVGTSAPSDCAALPIPRAAPRVTATRGCCRSALSGDIRWTARAGVQERVGGRFVQPVLHADVASCRDRVAKQIEGLPGPARRRAQHDVRAIAASRIWSAM